MSLPYVETRGDCRIQGSPAAEAPLEGVADDQQRAFLEALTRLLQELCTPRSGRRVDTLHAETVGLRCLCLAWTINPDLLPDETGRSTSSVALARRIRLRGKPVTPAIISRHGVDLLARLGIRLERARTPEQRAHHAQARIAVVARRKGLIAPPNAEEPPAGEDESAESDQSENQYPIPHPTVDDRDFQEAYDASDGDE